MLAGRLGRGKRRSGWRIPWAADVFGHIVILNEARLFRQCESARAQPKDSFCRRAALGTPGSPLVGRAVARSNRRANSLMSRRSLPSGTGSFDSAGSALRALPAPLRMTSPKAFARDHKSDMGYG